MPATAENTLNAVKFRAAVFDTPDGPTNPRATDVLPTARQAWLWLADHRRNNEDEFPDWPADQLGEYTETLTYLDYAGTEQSYGDPHEDIPLDADGTGEITGDTPGHTGPGHDAGTTYLVTREA